MVRDCMHHRPTRPLCTGTQYTETLRVQVHATCHLRRVFFSDSPLREEELPSEFRLYVPS